MIKYIRSLFPRTNKLLLGRWSLKHNCKTECIVVNYANMDHCGDCGTPDKYKKLTDTVQNRNLKNTK